MSLAVRCRDILEDCRFPSEQKFLSCSRYLAIFIPLFLHHSLLQAQSISGSPALLKQLSLEQLMDVDVTSVSRYPEKLSEAASAIQVIGQEEIRRSGATNLPEALRLASNLQVAQKNANAWAISARGFNTDLSNKLLVMIDGRTVYTPLFSGVFWDAQDYLLEDIDRIEVISGPGGTLWGANAVNGVINIITKSAKDTQGLYVEGGGGTELQDFAGLRYGGTVASDVAVRVYGKYFDRDAETLANGKDAADSWNMGQGGFRIDATASSRDKFTAQGDLYSSEEHNLMAGETNRTGGNFIGRWSHTLSADSDLSLQLYYDRTHLSESVPAYVLNSIVFAPAGTLRDDLKTSDVDFQHRFLLNQHNRVVWGLGYRYTQDVVQNAAALALLPPTLNHRLFSGFVQDEIRLGKNLALTLGTKLEHNDYTGSELEPSGRLQWTITAEQVLWTAISRAVRTPSRIDRDLSQPAPPHLVILAGNSAFKSETVVAHELGYRGQWSSTLATSIAVFYNRYDNLRSANINPVTIIPFSFSNNLEGETHGLELSATYQVFTTWRLRGGYNFLAENLHIKRGQMDLNNALNETADPKHQVVLHSSVDLPRDIELDTGLRWVDTLHNNNGPNVGTVPSYFEADVRLGWKVTNKLDLSVTGQNLLHNHHPEYGFPTVAREEISRAVVGRIVFSY